MEADRRSALAALIEQRATAVVTDSREVVPGAIFVALRGEHTDGHRFIADAIARGASAIVVEDESTGSGNVTVVRVPDTKRALSALAARFYGDPSDRLRIAGITGTNGKTTTSRMLAAIANAAGMPCGVVGTVGAQLGTHTWPATHTTPLPPELHALLAQMRDLGATAVAMEVSSHALALHRVNDVRFFVAALTNVTRDHLDFHGSMDDYRAAKRRLFALAPRCVMNADDPCGSLWARELAGEDRLVLTYGLSDPATIVARDVVVDADGLRFAVDGRPFALSLPGRFNVANALAALGIARLLGIDDEISARALAALERVPGRMERLRAGGIDVVVDYAHTPDALDNALGALRETSAGALAVVFGCGGDRDKGKRPEMGAVAAKLADRIYLTSDNPRSEEPRGIVAAIASGVGTHDHVIELDRRMAILRAVEDAAPGDVVLVAGKGHETYQVIGDRVLPFDDAAVAREALEIRASR